MNKVILLGYLARDPELREFPEKNFKVAKISIAVNDDFNFNKSYFFNCSAFGKTSDYVMNNLKKGDFVSIDGNLTNNSYINSDGKKVTYTDIIIQSIRNLGKRAPSSNKTTDDAPINSDNVVIDEYINNPELMNSNINEDDQSSSNHHESNNDDNDNFDDDIDWDD